MLPIQGAPPIAAPAAIARRATAGRTSAFAPADPAVPLAETASSGVAEPALAAAMLALQEGIGTQAAADAAVQDRRARRHGSDLLEALASLQRSILGAGSVGALHQLASLVYDPAEAIDPGLQRVVAEIHLRACVELARYEAG